MDLAIVERLACPNEHAPTPLVVRADEIEHGRLTAGLLGCPTCESEWPVMGGVAQFGSRNALSASECPDAESVAALLGLTEPGIVIVDGAPEDVVGALGETYQAAVIAFDAPYAQDASVIDGASRAPLASGIARAALLLRADRDAAFVESVARALAPRGRVLGALALVQPPTLTEMTRDDRWWLAERADMAAPIPLRRSGR